MKRWHEVGLYLRVIMKILSLFDGFYGKAIIGTLFLGIPFIALTGAGVIYLAESNLLLWWLGGSVVCYFLGTRLWIRASSREAIDTFGGGQEVVPEPFWNQADLAIWKTVLERASEIERGDRAMDSVEEAKADLENIARVIASAYHPRSNQPLLEVRAAHLLMAVEHVSRDLRVGFLEQVPFHEVLTVNELMKAKRSIDLIQMVYNGYRLVRPMVNPVSALVGEIRGLITRRAFDRISVNSSRWMKARLVECVGKHLINLYSGQVRSEDDLYDALRQNDKVPLVPLPEEKPLRVLLVGEVNAGKSSLINAMAGRMRSVSNYLPETKGALVIDVEVGGVGPVHLIDTSGYNFDHSPDEGFSELGGVLESADAVIVVSPATSAARSLDLRMVEMLKTKGVPIMVAVTKVDLLRPWRIWNPPYNVMDPDCHGEESARQKARTIRDCIEHIAMEFVMPIEHIVPLCVESAENYYNVDGLICALDDLLPDARRRLLRRVLVDYRNEQGYEEFKRSVVQSGRLLVRAGVELLLR
jgi:small GTP-binding protein